MQWITYKHPEKWTTVFGQRTKAETEAGWNDLGGQGNQQARERGKYCVIHPCTDKETALILSALFVRNVFAIDSCVHWDGNTVSMYCGDAGSGYVRTMELARELTLDTVPAYGYPLFAES